MTNLNFHWVQSVELQPAWEHPQLLDAVTREPLPRTWSNALVATCTGGHKVEVCFFSEGAPLDLWRVRK